MEDRQVHYDWIGRARAQYSRDLWELAEQRIMTLGSLVSAGLYSSRDKLRFKTESAEAAIGSLTVRRLRAMVTRTSGRPSTTTPVTSAETCTTLYKALHTEPTSSDMCTCTSTAAFTWISSAR